MMDFVAACMSQSDRNQKKRPILRVMSYLLQEAEAVSRNAKIKWCEANGVEVLNLQHDGVVGYGLPSGKSEHDVAAEMAMVATVACGFKVDVEAAPLGAPAGGREEGPSTAVSEGPSPAELEAFGLGPLTATRSH